MSRHRSARQIAVPEQTLQIKATSNTITVPPDELFGRLASIASVPDQDARRVRTSRMRRRRQEQRREDLSAWRKLTNIEEAAC